jgi:hypothetical protein
MGTLGAFSEWFGKKVSPKGHCADVKVEIVI